MLKNRRRFNILLITSASFLCCLVGCQKNTKTPIYQYSGDNAVKVGEIQLYFYDIPNLPYVNVKDYLDTFTGSYSTSNNNGVFTFTNNVWNGKSYYNGNSNNKYSASATYNSNTKVFKYDDYACFANINPYCYNPLDLVVGKGLEYKGKSLFKVDSAENVYVPGEEKEINLNDYNIDVRVSNGNLFMPLYTVKCLFNNNYLSAYFYNGSGLYQNRENENSSYDYKIKNGLFTPSSSYLEYAYNQFKLDLDLRFGLNGYTRTLRSGGSKEYSPSSYLGNYHDDFVKSATNFDTTALLFYASEMDDGGHTAINSKSYFSSNPEVSTSDLGKEINYTIASGKNIYDERKTEAKEIKKKFTSYYGSEINNTSYSEKTVLRLESFLSSEDNEDPGVETILKFIDLNKKQNTVVIDLSLNGGGYVYAQELLTTYLTRGKSQHFTQSSVNGSKSSIKYQINVNGDDVYNGTDDLLPESVTEIHLITSNQTFSAANATAALTYKYGTGVTMYGEQSGGGTCAVDSTMMNALGMNSSWSSTYMIKIDDGDESYEGIDNPSYTFTTSIKSQGTEASPAKFFDYASL